MDIEYPMDVDTPQPTPMSVVVSWVPPPSTTEAEAESYELYTDSDGLWVRYHWEHGASNTCVESFHMRWPPSRTSDRDCAWISVHRGLSPMSMALPEDEFKAKFKGDVEGLKAEFKAITAGGEDVEGTGEEERKVTPEMIDALAVKYGVLDGKWMIHTEPENVDQLWKKVVRIVSERGYGQAKVSTRKVLVLESESESQPHFDDLCPNDTKAAACNGGTPDPQERHVICVYVDDYTNKREVDELRRVLRLGAGVFWKIGFKTGAYTHLGIYKGNKLRLRPSRYHDGDNIDKATGRGIGRKSRGSWGGHSTFRPRGPVALPLMAE
ncbi:hypothetical protein P691DRAFT_807828 [Macrolepiota fuliginosa MF-IS2]|uniref:Uncharacterized protein n=1 Tax=Macrolepiota fuliginosa MF-IS2 TaxID=1400762 RepID=A0A9P5XKN0_9AGAR|nr:hypothetical protein P691DRAFT_807828 [Macrolepiota fuliginosa MF-IS2]